MRTRLFLILLAVAGTVHAADTTGLSHESDKAGDDAAKPMAWRYRLLETAQDVFDKRAAKQAPGATMSFRLPKVDPAQAGNQVAIVLEDKRIPLPMTSANTFGFVRDYEAQDRDALVVANRYFPKGQMNHPLVQVRSPGLPDGVKRIGDLRLACAAQIEMAKAEGLKFRAVLATVSLFGLNICDKLEVTKIEAPAAPYDTVTIEDGARRLVQPAKQRDTPLLNDKAWSDNARITYTLNERVVQ
jgi:hypothetical protein